MYNSEILLLYLSVSIFCYFILQLHYISETSVTLFMILLGVKFTNHSAVCKVVKIIIMRFKTYDHHKEHIAEGR